ncbi:MAG: hypothetical protein IT430_13815 [Phycisphaerales bacterium]|nr:hypothetical protein [Phycisphaerales bacterium]
MREQTAGDQRAAVLATGDAGSVPREIVRVECDCETLLGAASVVEIDRKQVGHQLVARMASYCAHCKQILTFSLVVDPATGRRQMQPVLARRRLRGAPSIDRFLTQYPQCRGIVQ